MNVLVGPNGAGKSSVLDALAILLSWAVSRTISARARGSYIGKFDIRNGTGYASLKITTDANIEWSLVKVKKGGLKPPKNTDLIKLGEYTEDVQSRIAANQNEASLVLFVYYPVERAVLDIPLRIRSKHKFEPLDAYEGSLTSGANFRTFFEWFREREDLENESKVHSRSGKFVPDRQLEAVRGALREFLPEFDNLTVRRSPLRMEVEKNGKILRIEQLSGGEKILIALIGDLARRLAIANPGSANPLHEKGIVLIDEADLHLHPRWQRMLIPCFSRIFPACQFIISTHSPHVITHTRPEYLFLLEEKEGTVIIRKASESYGKNADRVLEDLMGLETTRPEDVSARLHSIAEKIDRNEFDEAKKEIEELQADIGSDPELVKAETLIKRKEIIGR